VCTSWKGGSPAGEDAIRGRWGLQEGLEKTEVTLITHPFLRSDDGAGAPGARENEDEGKKK